MDHLGLEKEEDLITWAYKKNDEGWQRVANLGTVAHLCAKQNDAKAIEIIESAANALYVTIKVNFYFPFLFFCDFLVFFDFISLSFNFSFLLFLSRSFSFFQFLLGFLF